MWQNPPRFSPSRSAELAIRVARCGADGILAVLLASRCAACDGPLERPLDGPVCETCWHAIRFITPPVCDRCGDPLPSWRVLSRECSVCPRCRRTDPAVDQARSLGPYEGALRAIIHAWKYDPRRSLVVRLAGLVRQQVWPLLLDADAIVPVPLHHRRRRQRGFNQAEDLAARLGPPVWRMLRRTRATIPQVDLPASRRHANVRRAFAVRRCWKRPFGPGRAAVVGRCLVLVDDVATTGATLEACARVLKEAGAAKVRAITVARVAGRRP